MTASAAQTPDEQEDCPFCDRIARGEFDYSWLNAVSFEPLNPITPGHRLFVTRSHDSPLDNPFRIDHSRKAGRRYYASVGDVLPLLYSWRDREGIDEQYNLILNAGPDASQTVEHIHVHYIPRRPDDGLVLPWTTQESRS